MMISSSISCTFLPRYSHVLWVFQRENGSKENSDNTKAAFLAARIRAPVAKRGPIAERPVVAKDFFGRVISPTASGSAGDEQGKSVEHQTPSQSQLGRGEYPAKQQADTNRVWFRFHEVCNYKYCCTM